MDWRKYYNERLTTAEEAVKHIESNSVVVFQHAVGEPQALVAAMVANAASYKNVEVTHMFTLGTGAYTAPEYKENFHANSWFHSTPIRKNANAHGDYTTCYFHEVPELIRNGTFHVDYVLASLTPPDENGNMSTGVSGDYTVQAIKSAKCVIAQINKNLPYTQGDVIVNVKDVDWFVECDEPLKALPLAKIGPVEEAIGAHCASIVKDGDCLQLGIGSIPDAVCAALHDRKHLGIHSEMLGDGPVQLFKSGAVDNSLKQIDNGKLVFNFAMGSQAVYDFCDHNDLCRMMPVDYVNDPRVISKNDNVVSINGGLEVDFYGQVAADMIGYQQFSGVGGQVDFIRGAAWSKGGRAIIAMPSVTVKKDGTMLSKIKPLLTEGAAVATSRNDVDYVCTEQGIVRLKGKTTKQRARLLISIAHPDFRDQLAEDYEKFFGEKF